MYYATSSTPAPFAKAILESGATTARSVLYPTHPRHLIQFREFLIAAGIEHTPEQDILPTLRKLPVNTITNASRAIWNQYNASVCWPFQPVIDGPNSLANSSHAKGLLNGTDVADPVIPDLPITSWRLGNHLRIPVMTGFNTNEGTMFVPQHANTNEEFRSFFKTLIPTLSEADLAELEALYPDPVTNPRSPYKKVWRGMGRQWARLDAAYSHFAYICPVLHTAHFLSTADTPAAPSTQMTFSKSSHQRSDDGGRPPVYIYRYAATATWGTANHGDEAPVVAHDMGVIAPHGNATRPGTHAIADAMHGAWVNFIVSGNPNPVPTPAASRPGVGKASATVAAQWAPFESPFARRRRRDGDAPPPAAGRVMVFGEGNDEREPGRPAGRKRGVAAAADALSAADMERCRFWWDRVELSQGAGRPRRGLEKGAKL
jgi:carboxylesterase type B